MTNIEKCWKAKQLLVKIWGKDTWIFIRPKGTIMFSVRRIIRKCSNRSQYKLDCRSKLRHFQGTWYTAITWVIVSHKRDVDWKTPAMKITKTKRERWKGRRRNGRRIQNMLKKKKTVTFGKQDMNRSNWSSQVTGHVLLTALRGITVVFVM